MVRLTLPQINLLASALKWLTYLIALSIILLINSLAWFVSGEQAIAPAQLQCGSNSTPKIKSVALLTPTLQKGKLLFVTNCQACHEVTVTKLVGPGLLGVAGRVPDQQWLIRWIKNPAAVLNSGEVYANQLIKGYAPTIMPGFPTLKEAEIKAILAYIDSYKVEEQGLIE